jgi:hypothetical protein
MKKNVLFCYSRLVSFTNAVRDYVQAFGDYSSHNIHYYDTDSGSLDINLEPFDSIIFNYCYWSRCWSIPKDLLKRLSTFSGLKIAIFQDEYDYFLWHEKTIISLNIDIIITCVPEKHWRDVFRDDAFRKVIFINALTGYVPDSFLNFKNPIPLKDRAWSLGYRSRPLPYTYGRLAWEKQIIGQRMKQICTDLCIPTNIEVSEESRIYGIGWLEFLGNCRAVLGVESGSNVFDFDGSLKPAIKEFIKNNPTIDFDAIYERFLKGNEEKIYMNQISPRIFEAIAMKTALVLFEGNYSGVIQPWIHYIPLKKDFSNVSIVLTFLNDYTRMEEMINKAYDDIIISGKYHFKNYINLIDSHISKYSLRENEYKPIYGVIAWRKSPDLKLEYISSKTYHSFTQLPLRHFDFISESIITIRWGEIYRSAIRFYEKFLYSPRGRKIKSLLQKNKVLFSVLQRLTRKFTGRTV